MTINTYTFPLPTSSVNEPCDILEGKTRRRELWGQRSDPRPVGFMHLCNPFLKTVEEVS